MHVIRFRKTPKGDLTQFSLIFRNPNPMDKKFKFITCSKNGVIFHIYAMGAGGNEVLKGPRLYCLNIILQKLYGRRNKGIGQFKKEKCTSLFWVTGFLLIVQLILLGKLVMVLLGSSRIL